MAKSLVIVESPAKAKTIGKYLGKQFIVKASLGHVKDLPKKDLAVDVDKNFEPHYEVIEGKKSEDQVLTEFLSTMEGITGNHDGIVTFDEFKQYYTELSASIPTDTYRTSRQ